MKDKKVTTSCLLAGTLFLSACTSAYDLGEDLANESDSVLLKNQNNNYTHWNGIGKIFWNAAPVCTATLLDTRDSNNEAAGPAYLLTNAHCVVGVSGPRPPPPFKEAVTFNYFNDTPDTHKSYTIKETVWKDYKYADLAIMELDVPLATLLEDGITPLRLASERAKEPSDILIVGAPGGLPQAGLRLAACAQEPTAGTLVEQERAYQTTLKNRCKEIRPGSSGSPVLDRRSGHILSVLATSTYGATIDEKCFKNAPCEVKSGQPEWSPDTHYSHPVNYLSSCFTGGVFSSDSNMCTTGSKLEAYLKYWPTQYIAMPRTATSPDPFITAEFSLNKSHLRFKTVRDVAHCELPDDYSAAIGATDAEINALLSRDPGMHFLCVVGVESANQELSEAVLKDAWITPAQLVERTPIRMPEPTITLTAQWNYEVKWKYLSPLYSGTLYYAGPTKDTDCSTIKIADYIDNHNGVTFRAEQLPLTLCSRNLDSSDRYSKVRTDLLALP
ncbi:trypsin-like serine peptidase [Pseudomonas sp. ZT5P21]